MQVGVDQEPVDTQADPLDGDVRLSEVFGSAWPSIAAFHDVLAAEGPVRGLIGPRETSRLWERHLLNSAAVVPALQASRSLIDLGSGAGLPGIVVAAMAPSVHVTLLEPMARRVEWLDYVVQQLALANVTVVRGRAEDLTGSLRADAVTARAVASMDKLYRWAAPLVPVGGSLLALKGSHAADEVEAAAGVAAELGWSEVEVRSVRVVDGVEPTTVVRAVKGRSGRRVR